MNMSEINLSFSGCGFLGIFYVGAITAIKKYSNYLIKKSSFSGSSAGALTGAIIACDCDMSKSSNVSYLHYYLL